VRDTAPSRVAPDELVEPVAFDFGRPETHGPALAGVRGVFLVRPPELGDTRRYFDPFISAARDAGVRRVVFLSLQGADRLRVVPHRRIERSLEHSGLPYTFLRSSFFMQNLSTIHRAEIRDTGEIFVPAGRGRTSFVDVRDIAAVAVRALSEPGHEGRAYELTGSEALNYFQVASILSEALGRRIEYANPSIPAFLASMRRRRYRPGFALVTTAIYTTARLGFAGRVSPDTGQLLGRPPCSLRRFAEDYAGCWRRGSDTESG
jgi:uncharacterized protein YbjT (DUF2867 family)